MTRLPAEGRRGDPPAWPLDGPSDAERAVWREAWRTPHAVMWERLGHTRTVARFVRLLTAAEARGADARVLAEVRQLEDRLGLSPLALLRLRWEIFADEGGRSWSRTSRRSWWRPGTLRPPGHRRLAAPRTTGACRRAASNSTAAVAGQWSQVTMSARGQSPTAPTCVLTLTSGHAGRWVMRSRARVARSAVGTGGFLSGAVEVLGQPVGAAPAEHAGAGGAHRGAAATPRAARARAAAARRGGGGHGSGSAPAAVSARHIGWVSSPAAASTGSSGNPQTKQPRVGVSEASGVSLSVGSLSPKLTLLTVLTGLL